MFSDDRFPERRAASCGPCPAACRKRWPGLYVAVSLFFAVPMPATADRAPEPDPTPIEFDLTLEDAIEIALERNQRLLDARLDRRFDKFNLEAAEDTYRPRFGISSSFDFTEADSQKNDASGTATARLNLPTGGAFTLGWTENWSDEGPETWSQTTGFSQPLLKGAWLGIANAPLRRALITERRNIIGFRRTVAQEVDNVIGAYRRLIQAIRRVRIDETSVQRAREQREATQALIRAGRVAPREAVRSEASIANRELSLARSRNALDDANYTLIKLLEFGSTVRIRPLETLRIERRDAVVEPPFEEVLRNHPDFLLAMLTVESAIIDEAVARNGLLPDLDLRLSHGRDSSGGPSDYRVGLNATIPLNDRAPSRAKARADYNLRKARRNLAETRETIRRNLRQAVNSVEVNLRVSELARGARELAEENLEIERMKFGQGLSSTFEVTASEDDLVRAEQAEIDAIIGWLDALTNLDRTSGKTLATWGIDLEAVAR